MTLTEIVAELERLAVEVHALRLDIDQARRLRYQRFMFASICSFSADGNHTISVFGRENENE